MRILITGASGFIGSHTTRLVVQNNDEVALLCRPGSDLWRLNDLAGRLIRLDGDLKTIDNAATALHEFRPDVLIHTGWMGVSAAQRNDAALMQQNIDSSLSLFEMCCETGCREIIALGSQAEYGPYNIPLNEDLPAAPQSAYGKAKLKVALDGAALCSAYDARFVWLRLLSCYGPAEETSRMIPYLITTLLKGDSPQLSSGAQLWDYLHVNDVAHAVAAALKSDAAGIFNLCSAQPITIRSVVELVRDLIDPSIPLNFGTDLVPDLSGSNARLLQTTGWRPTVPLAAGLQETVDWYRDNALVT